LYFITAGDVYAQDIRLSDSLLYNETSSHDNNAYLTPISEAAQSVQKRVVPDTILRQIKSEKAYWYANEVPPRQLKEEKSSDFRMQQWMITALWLIIIGVFIAIVIGFLASSNIHLFRRRAATVLKSDEGVSEENLFTINYDNEIRSAVNAGNYRLAIRLWYLQTLKNLAEDELISYKQESTNSQYLQQLNDTNFYKPFRLLTRSFEYAWYGQFTLSQRAFERIQQDFTDFNQQLRR
jgi:hypothetical protein